MTLTQQRPPSVEQYLAAFQALAQNGASKAPDWLQDLRKVAIDRFASLGFPTARRGNEEWKYTDVRPLADQSFKPVAGPFRRSAFQERDWQRFTFAETGWYLLTFIDGRFSRELSSRPPLRAGATAEALTKALARGNPQVQHHLAQHASYQTNAFTALNTAFLQEGGLVHIPDGVTLEQPIHLLFLSTSRGAEAAAHPRVLVIAGRESSATVIESYASLGDDAYFSNSVTELVLGQGASLSYYKMQRQSQRAYHVTTTEAVLDRDSSLFSANVDLGGGLVRNNLNVRMAGENASCQLYGLYMVNGDQHVDNQVIVEHLKPHTTTKELYKGILDGTSRSVFHGSIIVREGAKGVVAYQVDKNLLLSDKAEADTKPAFWVYTDDVKCGHGAACGQIDQNSLFYLRSRGLDEKTARNYLIHGFVSEVIDSIKHPPFRAHVNALVHIKLEEWLTGTRSPQLSSGVED